MQELKNIAVVQMGYAFRGRLENSDSGNVAVIQMKDLPDSGVVDCVDLIKIEMSNLKDHHRVKKGDLVFRSRGQINTSVVVFDCVGTTIVAAPLLRIRIKSFNRILPEYLNWYIGQNEAQRFLKSRQEGTHGGMISQKTLEQLPVYIPSLEKQKQILELATLAVRESNILKELAQKKKMILFNKLMQFAKGE